MERALVLGMQRPRWLVMPLAVLLAGSCESALSVAHASCAPVDFAIVLQPATLPELIATCPDGATLEYDTDGVQTLCTYREPGCFDSCDEGYHVVRWDHGVFEGDATTDEVCAE